jgi:glycosyltransferase involved in cell wall biosynthesis
VRLCFIADGRTSHIHNWMRHFIEEGHEVHLISTYPCTPGDPPVASLHVVPTDFSAGLRARVGGAEERTTNHGSRRLAKLRGTPAWLALAGLRDRLAPWVMRCQRGRLRRLVEGIGPDLVLAQRIPFEGVLAAMALRGASVPLVVSSWGTDFTHVAAGSRMMSRMTRLAMAGADGFHADCRRDLRLAREHGLDPSKPSAVLIGAGGIRPETFHPGPPDASLARRLEIPEGAPVVINPRGMKTYIRNDTFFRAIPRVLREEPRAVFLCGMMEGNAVAEGWVSRLGLRGSVRLLPFLPHARMAEVYRLASVVTSLSDHDGTPNSMLEAMACGLFPVAGGIESVREWIDDGVNGLLCDPGSPEEAAGAILRALRDDDLRRAAAAHNRRLIADRADHGQVMADAMAFYREVVDRAAGRRGRRLAASSR